MKLIRLSLILLLLCSTTPLWSDGGLQFKGKLRLLKPTTLQVKDLNGNLILSCPISQNGVFETEKKEISPDVYTLYIGNTEQNIYFENVPVSINGFFDEKNPEQSSLSFTGIDSFLTLQNYMPTEKDPDIATISASVKGKLTPGMAAALAYLANVNDYYSNKMLLDMIPENERTSFVAKWLVNRVEVLSHQIINAECPDFTFINANGKNVSLKDFRGKIVVLDFCASWCGPCRKEMRSMLTIYNELKADDLEFISVSLDDSEAKWRKMLDEEKLPWVMLWDKTGFPKNSKTPSAIQAAYGFYSIPFLVVIDKEGKLAARNVRGEQVREAILKIRK
ncbi:TlpA family protein disulfide reductase [Candidatus Bacteroides intestinigallinarum]|uniref:peroxiredoxin family protein n=1 Tax=Bacteroides TaxID=816 RepID=UPI000E8CA1B8|nr:MULTISPECIES: TlpA disulfide reductase family protein [Bacteroides]MCS3177031.1 TlpA family protein disulfide reductase [Candidatus Bacteroides intestinigallinarum]RGN62107.1 TlpA family protein disulfide reductase [Bacteroides sp. OM05-10AA]RGQ66430.1 TlpA family protein disulfide reductase [Bacteroides sp. AF27-33]